MKKEEEKKDVKALCNLNIPADLKGNFEEYAKDLKVQNEVYLRHHPELHVIIQTFLKILFEEKPENPISFAGQFFDNPNFRSIIQEEIKKRQEFAKQRELYK